MNRRNFLKNVFKTTCIVAAGPAAIMGMGRKPFTPPLTNKEKELIIAQALQTPEGREAMAKAMVEPIRRSLEYQAVGRKLLMVDELPQGTMKKYERDVSATVNMIRKGII